MTPTHEIKLEHELKSRDERIRALEAGLEPFAAMLEWIEPRLAAENIAILAEPMLKHLRAAKALLERKDGVTVETGENL